MTLCAVGQCNYRKGSNVAATLSSKNWHALQAELSADRLSPYAFGSDYDHAIASYLWNVALCEALYPLLHAVEVGVRNRMDSVLSRRLGANWIKDGRFLGPTEMQRIQEACEKLASRGKGEPTHSQLVAEVTFGFWAALFTKYYEHQNQLWPRFARDLMKGAPRHMQTRAEFHFRIDRVRNLRNRAFHYEPLWHWGDLEEQYEESMELLFWISPETAKTMKPFDRFADVYTAGILTYERLLAGGHLCPLHGIGCSIAECPSR